MPSRYSVFFLAVIAVAQPARKQAPPAGNGIAITDADIASSNLVLWGGPGTNRVLARIAGQLPAGWSDASRAPVLNYPNPLNPKKYVLLDSGFTFAAEAATRNSRQTPKLSDYAVLDLAGGKIVRAGFFDEEWRM